MGIIRVLDTGESVPATFGCSTPSALLRAPTPTYHPSSNRPLLTDAERTRSQRHTERLRRKRAKRRRLQADRQRLVERARTDPTAKARLERTGALRALEKTPGVIVDRSAYAPFRRITKPGHRIPGQAKDRGFGKRNR